MTIKNDASLRGKAKALANKYGLSAQEVMQRYASRGRVLVDTQAL